MAKTGELCILVLPKTARRLLVSTFYDTLMNQHKHLLIHSNLPKSSTSLTWSEKVKHHSIQLWQGHVFGATRHQILQNPSGTLCTEALCIQWLNRWHLSWNHPWTKREEKRIGMMIAWLFYVLQLAYTQTGAGFVPTHLFSLAGFGFKIKYASWQTSRVHMSWTIDLISYLAS